MTAAFQPSMRTTFTYTRKFNTSADNYTFALPYISSNTPNGSDPSTGAAITGFKWWNFTFPTIVDSGIERNPGLRDRDEWHGELWRHCGSVSNLGRNLCDLERSHPSKCLGCAVDCADSHHRAPRYGDNFLLQRNLHVVRDRRSQASARGPEHNFRFSDARVPGGSDQRHSVTVSAVDITTSAGQNTITSGPYRRDSRQGLRRPARPTPRSKRMWLSTSRERCRQQQRSIERPAFSGCFDRNRSRK